MVVERTADIMRMSNDEPGHEKVGAAKLGIEEHARPEVDRGFHAGHAGPLQRPHACALRIVGRHRLHVADGRGGCRPVRTVRDCLYFHRLAVGRVAAEPARDHQRDERLSFVQQAVDLPAVLQHLLQVEVLRVEEELEELPARRGPVVVQHGQPDVPDVEADGEAEHQEKEQGHREKHPQGNGVPRYLAKLLDHDRGMRDAFTPAFPRRGRSGG